MVAVGKCQHYPCYLKKGWMKYRKLFSFALFRSSHITWSAKVWAKLKYLRAGRILTYHILERQTNKQQPSQPGYIWSLPSGSLSPQDVVLCCPSTAESGRTKGLCTPCHCPPSQAANTTTNQYPTDLLNLQGI